jgi:hypothetical protein
MAAISDIIYQLEITEHIDLIDLSISDTIKITRYLINNLQDDHQMPGNVYYQFIGILDWHKENHFITDKQHYWLLDHLWQYIDQRTYTFEEML